MMVRMQWALVLVFVLVSSGLVFDGVRAVACAEPIRIGALTAAWGPPGASLVCEMAC